MLVVGAGGFAKEVAEIIFQNKETDNLVFFDDVNKDKPKSLFGVFPILSSFEEAASYLNNVDSRFTIGVGNPVVRYKLYRKFASIGGEFISTISPMAMISHYDVQIGLGSNVLPHSIFSSSSKIGKGCIVYYNATVTHDCVIGDFVQLSPNTVFLGRCSVGSFSQIGANATILPDVTIGKNVIVGAGCLVNKDVPDDCVVVGVPFRIIRELPQIQV